MPFTDDDLAWVENILLATEKIELPEHLKKGRKDTQGIVARMKASEKAMHLLLEEPGSRNLNSVIAWNDWRKAAGK